MRRALAPALGLALILGVRSASAAGPASDAESLRQTILEDNDPAAAAAFLASPAEQRQLAAADPDLSVKVFERAAELKDLADLLQQNTDVRPIRLGLQQRALCAFCQKPQALESWAEAKLSLDIDHQHALSRAVADWNGLPPEGREWLARQGRSEAEWSRTDLPPRLELLHRWSLELRDSLLQQDPGDKAAYDRFGVEATYAMEYLGAAEYEPLDDHWRKVDNAFQGLQTAAENLKKKNDPRLAAALAAAQSAGDVESRLAALSKVFENSADAAAARALAPARPGQQWTDARRALVADLLATALPASTKGTWAGKDLHAFYAKNPLKVVVKPTSDGSLASYWGGALTFSESAIAQFVKSQGRDIADLASDKKLLDALIVQVAPIYVHESTHYMQDVWAKSQGIPFGENQLVEREAMQVEALFVSQKLRADPKFRAALLKEARSSINARETLTLAAQLTALGPAGFRQSIDAEYPESLSLEGAAWSSILAHNELRPDLDAELARRAALPKGEREALEAGLALQATYPSREVFLAALKEVATSQIVGETQAIRQLALQDEEQYRRWRQREEAVNGLTAQRLELLESGKLPGKDEVPSPVVTSSR